jgi:hypothetical protein
MNPLNPQLLLSMITMRQRVFNPNVLPNIESSKISMTLNQGQGASLSITYTDNKTKPIVSYYILIPDFDRTCPNPLKTLEDLVGSTLFRQVH